MGMEDIRASLVYESKNKKTGPMPVSITSRHSCPKACPLMGNGCYAEGGKMRLHWAAVTSGKRGWDWDLFCRRVAAIPEGAGWRHNQAGDLPGDGERINAGMLGQLVEANRGRRGFTYTHYPMAGEATVAEHNRAAVAHANANGFTINLSADGVHEVDALVAHGVGPVVTVLPIGAPEKQRTAGGNLVVKCPIETGKATDCKSCMLCYRVNRKTVVGFTAHGNGARKADAVARKG